MGIESILSTSLTGLSTSLRALNTTSSNIANVNTPDYVRRVVQQESLVLAGQVSGVKIGEVRRITDEFLSKQLRLATADAGRYEAMTIIHERLQSFLGSPNENITVPGRLDVAFNAFADLVPEPDSTVRRLTMVNDLQAYADEVTRIGDHLQLLRQESDRRIGEAIDTINTALERLIELNPRIAQTRATGDDSTALEEQRTQALAEIGELIDIRTTDLDNGFQHVTTTTGLALLDSIRRKLVYTPEGTVTPNTRFSQIPANKIDSVTGQAAATGTALDPEIGSGQLRGLIDMRNTVLPNIALELGELSARVVDELNRVHNDNSAVPPPTSLTGRASGLLGTDAHGFTGTAIFVVTDTNEEITRRIDIDFTANTIDIDSGGPAALSGTTLADVVGDINTALGAGRTFSLSSAGAITFSSANAGEGVAIVQGTTGSDRGGRGFAHYFGMNDLMSATAESHFDTGFTTASAHGFGATGIVQIELRGPSGELGGSFSLDFSSVGGTAFSDVLSSLDTGFSGVASFTLDTNGALVLTPASDFEDYTTFIVSDTTNRSSTGKTFSDLFGLGERFLMNAARGVKVVDRITTDPKLLALADVDLAAATGVPALTPGDSRGAIALQNVAELSVSFGAAGDIAAVTTTLTSFAGTVLSQMSTKAATAESIGRDREALKDTLAIRVSEVSGVNLDEELANMILFQNAYTASARLISTSRELFDTLLEIAG